MERKPRGDRRAAPVVDRKPWPAWKRYLLATGHGLHRLLVHPWLDAKGYGSIPAISAGLYAGVMTYRIGHVLKEGESFASLGWPEALIVFAPYLGVALYEAAMTLARIDPGRLVDAVTGRFGVGDVVHQGEEKYFHDEDRPRREAPDPEDG